MKPLSLGRPPARLCVSGDLKLYPSLAPLQPAAGNFVWQADGTVVIRESGRYTFCTRSDDGSKLWFNQIYLVANDGIHGPTVRDLEPILTSIKACIRRRCFLWCRN